MLQGAKNISGSCGCKWSICEAQGTGKPVVPKLDRMGFWEKTHGSSWNMDFKTMEVSTIEACSEIRAS